MDADGIMLWGILTTEGTETRKGSSGDDALGEVFTTRYAEGHEGSSWGSFVRRWGYALGNFNTKDAKSTK